MIVDLAVVVAGSLVEVVTAAAVGDGATVFSAEYPSSISKLGMTIELLLLLLL